MDGGKKRHLAASLLLLLLKGRTPPRREWHVTIALFLGVFSKAKDRRNFIKAGLKT
jgi:hypothetical protein